MNPSNSPAFYDIIYDDTDCPEGIESDAIPDYVYFGPMIATMAVRRHSECVAQCVTHTKCVAVNFFEPITFQENGFCELLSQTQLDNPRLMRRFRKAIYFENIKCREKSNDVVLGDVVHNDNNNNNDNITTDNEQSSNINSHTGFYYLLK
ncbi:unnamed protein product [Dracunculus medinensis]|uniref:Apple domain-containing protein n=1 Tax=Dracunculus medinensis TaxID=318479 RepID=A0A0N4UGG1_DRAME|nr:unnamed protein product [Dracunculus medinensis]